MQNPNYIVGMKLLISLIIFCFMLPVFINVGLYLFVFKDNVMNKLTMGVIKHCGSDHVPAYYLRFYNSAFIYANTGVIAFASLLGYVCDS